MKPTRTILIRERSLPRRLKGLFWDHRFESLSWDRDRDLIVGRILQSGDWQSVNWLRGRLGDPALRAWILRREGRGLDARRLRFWELILDLPHRLVNRWLTAPERAVWDRRFSR